MTLEVSSFQLEAVRSFRPHIAVWLNFAADHLDRYATMDDYRHAKLRIFENQTAEDFAVVNLRDLHAGMLDRRGRDPHRIATRARLVTFSAYAPGAEMIDAIVALWKALEAQDEERIYTLSPLIGAILALGTGLDGYLTIEKHLLVRRGIFKNTRLRGPVGFTLDEYAVREVDRLFDRLMSVL